jgi:glycosyltransferase involved in cell wall biosynthesis
MLAKRAHAFLAYTDRGRDALIESGVPAEKVFVTRNTLDTERLMKIADGVTADDLSGVRHNLGIGDKSVLLMMGRLLPEKRVDVLIEAVRLIGDMHEDVALIVIGDGVERRRLEEQAGGLGRVRFLGPIYDERELAPYLLVADLLVIPGRIGLTCVHGFTAALPSVTASAEVVHQSPEYDYIENESNGILIPDLSPGAFAQTISEVLRDRDRLLDLSRSARRTAGSLSMGNMVEEFVKGVRYARQPSTSPTGTD